MQLTIVVPDNLVIINGHALNIDLNSMMIDTNLHALQWEDDQGEEEYTDGTPNQIIYTLQPYQAAIDEHRRLKAVQEAPQHPPTKEELKQAEREWAAGELSYTDRYMRSDFNITEEQRQAVIEYCHKLRNPQRENTEGYPDQAWRPKWPEGVKRS